MRPAADDVTPTSPLLGWTLGEVGQLNQPQCVKGFSHWVTSGHFFGVDVKNFTIGFNINFDADVKKDNHASLM